MADYSDARAIKALAHPLRVRLLQALALRGIATATELSDDVGESPSNCSFHLRKLAEFGYIERAGDDGGRDRPWRIPDPTQNFRPAEDDPAAQRAAQVAWSSIQEWDFSLIRAADSRTDPERWRRADLRSASTLLLTPEEADRLQHGIADLIAPYVDRFTHREEIPDGAGAVRVFATMVYLGEHQEVIDRMLADRSPASDGEAS